MSVFRNHFFLAFLSSCLLFSACTDQSKDSAKEKEQFLTYILQEPENNPVKSACIDFLSIENLCIISSESSLFACSDDELSRLRSNISPESLRTDSILIRFINCWKKCNLSFNAQDSICSSGSKYNNTSQYRQVQKSGTTQASITWGLCMDTCNKGSTNDETLQSSGATYQGQAF